MFISSALLVPSNLIPLKWLYATVEDKEITQWIFSKGYFIGDMPGRTFNVPSRWNIQALMFPGGQK